MVILISWKLIVAESKLQCGSLKLFDARFPYVSFCGICTRHLTKRGAVRQFRKLSSLGVSVIYVYNFSQEKYKKLLGVKYESEKNA